MNGLLAFYGVQQKNVSEYIPELYDPNRANCCGVSRLRTSRGVELEMEGEPATGWLLGGGYSYNQHSGVIPYNTELTSPKHVLKLWTSVQLPGELSRWTVGGNVDARSRTISPGNCPRCANVTLVQPRYAVVDLRAGLRIDDHWQLALSLNNVFDTTYFETVNAFRRSYYYGEPRNVMLRIDARL